MMMTVNCRCPLCGAFSTITCLEESLQAYEEGALAQDAFADMSIHARETLISGMCLPCQESFFTEDENGCNGECDVCADLDCPFNVSWLDSDDKTD